MAKYMLLFMDCITDNRIRWGEHRSRVDTLLKHKPTITKNHKIAS
jgi:hypothetical protein